MTDFEAPLAGRVAYVTGAARGQGRSHCIRLARAGADSFSPGALPTDSLADPHLISDSSPNVSLCTRKLRTFAYRLTFEEY